MNYRQRNGAVNCRFLDQCSVILTLKFSMITAIERLDDDIARCVDSRVKACLRAQRGIYIARNGKVLEAVEIAESLRVEFGANFFLELATWLLLLDGIILFYERPDSDAADRIRRGYCLSRVIPKSEAGTSAVAWLAHVEFNRSEFVASLALCAEALANAVDTFNGTLARVALTVADTFYYCGNYAEAKIWYQRARQQSLKDGDRVTLSGVLHNLAAFGTNHLMLKRFCNYDCGDLSLFSKLSLDSSRNYDGIIGLLSLHPLEPIVRAKKMIVDGNFRDALTVLSGIPESLGKFWLNRYRSIVLACQLICRVKIGIESAFVDSISDIIGSIEHIYDHDDRAIVYGIVSEVLLDLGRISESAAHALDAKEQLDFHRCRVDCISEELRSRGLESSHWVDLYGPA